MQVWGFFFVFLAVGKKKKKKILKEERVQTVALLPCVYKPGFVRKDLKISPFNIMRKQG